MKKITSSLILLLAFFTSKAQHNYDNQSVIYSNNGKVGIGTSSPLEYLHVNGGSVDGVIWPTVLSNSRNSSTISNYGVGLKLKHSSNNELTKWGGVASVQESSWANSSGLALYANETEHVRIKSNGLVGIGTTAPQLQLHLKDPIGGAALGLERGGKMWRFDVAYNAASKLFIGHTDNSSFFTLTDQGKVGIGTLEPLSSLHIATNEDAVSWPVILNNARNSSTISGYGVGLKMKHSSNNENKWSGIASVQESTWANSSGLALFSNESEKVRITAGGNVGIGTTTPQSKLAVEGQIRATEVKVLADISVPDYVFESDYDLRTLEETKKYIKEHKHLPEIPSAAEIGENGIDLGDMNMRLLKKIEELTLYQIELLERVKKLESVNARFKELEEKVQRLEEK